MRLASTLTFVAIFSLCFVTLADKEAEEELMKILKLVDPLETGQLNKGQYADFLRYMILGVDHDEKNEMYGMINNILQDFMMEYEKNIITMDDIMEDMKEERLASYIKQVYSKKMDENARTRDDEL